MKVECTRDGTVFEAMPTSYPIDLSVKNPTEYAKGSKFINCPTCGRRYFQRPDGKYHSDRVLMELN